MPETMDIVGVIAGIYLLWVGATALAGLWRS